jgi:hypothetical protein
MRKLTFLTVAAVMTSTTLVAAQNASPGKNEAAENPSSAEDRVVPSASEKKKNELPGPVIAEKDRAKSSNTESGGSTEVEKSDRSAEKPKGVEVEGQAAVGEKLDRKADQDDKSSAGRVGDSKEAEGSKAGSKNAYKSVTGDQRTKLTSTFSRHRVEPARDLSFAINIGVSVPRNVRFYEIPEDIIVFVPEYRHYRYFLVGDQICIVDPETFEIVDIIVIA